MQLFQRRGSLSVSLDGIKPIHSENCREYGAMYLIEFVRQPQLPDNKLFRTRYSCFYEQNIQIQRDTRILQILHILFDYFPFRVRNLVSPNKDRTFWWMLLLNAYV